MALSAQQVFLAVVRADASQAVSELKKVDGTVDQTTATATGRFDKFSALAKGALAGIGASAVFELGQRAVNAASDLNESINAVRVTFGTAADGVLKLGEKAAESVGLSNAEFNQLAVSFSSFAKQVAGPGGDVVGIIQQLTVRAADFASVMNLDVNEATTVFLSTLAGETEPIRRFGKDVSAASVEAFAYAKGIAEVGSKLTESEKVQARFGLLMQQTADTAGDFANTSDGLANQQRILTARLQDLSAQLGASLIPILEDASAAAIAFSNALDAIPGVDGVGSFFDAAWALTPIGGFNKLKDAIRGTLDEGTAAVDEFAGAASTMDILLGDLIMSTSTATREWERQTSTLETMIPALEGTSDGINSMSERHKRAEEAAKRHTDALERQRQKVDELYDANLQLVGGELAVRSAQNNASDAVARYSEIMRDAEASTLDKSNADIAAQDALLGAAQAAADYRAQQAEANGVTLTAKDRQFFLAEELKKVAATLDPSSPLRTALQQYIDELLRIPTQVTTNLTVTGQRFTATGDAIGQLRGAKAGGGHVGSGNWLVGERGPEVLSLGSGQTGFVTPNHALGGPMIGTLVVNAGFGVDGQQLARQLVEVINQGARSGNIRIAANAVAA